MRDSINRKGQEVVLRELFSFMLGITIMLASVMIFNNTIAPVINKYSLSQQTDALLTHAYALLEQAKILADTETGVELHLSLPDKISGQGYRIFVNGTDLCISTRGTTIIYKCIPSTIANLNQSSNFLSGTDISIFIDNGIAFKNYIPPIYYQFYEGCINQPVVNWNDHLGYFQTDILSCGCDSGNINTSSTDVEDGLPGWVLTNSILSSDQYQSYSNSIQVNTTSDTESVASVSVDWLVDSFNVSAYLSSETTGTYIVTANPVIRHLGTDYQIFYILYASPDLSPYCWNNMGTFYIDCSINSSGFNSWQTFTKTGIIDEFKRHWPNINFEERELSGFAVIDQVPPFGPGSVKAYFDDITFNGAFPADDKYCDKNNDGYADGICMNGLCISTFLTGFTSANSFLLNENPYVSVGLVNLNPQATCTLNINSINYEMDVFEDSASYELSSPLSKGAYIANVTCDQQSKIQNITIGPLKYSWTYTLNGNGLEDFRQAYFTSGEFLPSSPGKEIFYQDWGEQNVYILGSNGSLITNISTSVTGMQLADINFDGHNELIVKTHVGISVFNYALDVMWNTWNYMLIPVNELIGGIAVADINESNGLEILMNQYVFNSTGSLLWHNPTSGNGPEGDVEHASNSPVVDDINTANPGLELLFIDPKTDLRMLRTDGSLLYSFSLSGTVGLYGGGPYSANLRNDYPGKEVVLIANGTANQMYIYLLSSSLSEICHYSFAWDTNNNNIYDRNDSIPKAAAIGDVNNDGNNEVIVSAWNNTNFDSSLLINDHYYILDGNCNLIHDYAYSAHHGSHQMLAEIDNANPGLEIVSQEVRALRVINSSGNVLYSYLLDASMDEYTTGPNAVIDDIDNDGFIEIIGTVTESGNDKIFRLDGYTSATNNVWTTFKHDLNQTGYVAGQ